MKVGMQLRIDVTKIPRERIFIGQKGKYVTMTAFVDLDNKDQYDNNGMITLETIEGEDRAPILGNTRVFWTDAPQQQRAPQQPAQPQYQQPSQPRQEAPSQHVPTPSAPPQQPAAPQSPASSEFSDDIPF